MKITITPAMLCDLLDGKFTYEACEAICDLFDECNPEAAPYIGDIAISFGDLPAEYVAEDDESIIAHLPCGNVLIAY